MISIKNKEKPVQNTMGLYYRYIKGEGKKSC